MACYFQVELRVERASLAESHTVDIVEAEVVGDLKLLDHLHETNCFSKARHSADVESGGRTFRPQTVEDEGLHHLLFIFPPKYCIGVPVLLKGSY